MAKPKPSTVCICGHLDTDHIMSGDPSRCFTCSCNRFELRCSGALSDMSASGKTTRVQTGYLKALERIARLAEKKDWHLSYDSRLRGAIKAYRKFVGR